MKFYSALFIALFCCFFSFSNTWSQCETPEGMAVFETDSIAARLINCGLIDVYSGLRYQRDYPNHKVFLTADIWMGGIGQQGQLKVAAQTYHPFGYDFAPGPLNSDGEANESNCGNYDRFWQTNSEDIISFRQTFISNGGNIEEGDIPESVLFWPGKNNPFIIDMELPEGKDLAPFFDYNFDGSYNPLDGDFPSLKNGEVDFADEMLWQIYNDVGNLHVQSGGEEIGMELNLLVYGYDSPNIQGRTMFIDYDLNYFGTGTLTDFYIGFFVDPDLGDHRNDFVACVPDQNLAYVYNGVEYDEGMISYNGQIPVGVAKILEGLNDGSEDLGMSSFLYYNNDYTVTGNPSTPQDYYNYLQSKWKDGSEVTMGGNGYGGEIATNYMFPGDPSNANEWSECADGNVPSDRRFLMVSGPVDLQPGDSQNFKVALSVLNNENHDSYYCGNFDNENLLQHGMDLCHIDQFPPSLFSNDPTINLGINKLIENTVNAYPNPTTSFLNIEMLESDMQGSNLSVFSGNGQRVFLGEMIGNKMKLETSNFKTGIYYYQITNNDGEIATGKFVKE